MYKVVARWAYGAGSPGVSNFYFDTTGTVTSVNVANAQARVKAFFGAFTLCLPSAVTISYDQDSQVIDVATGNIINVLTAATAQSNTVGAAAANFSAVSGACVSWRTGVFLGGHSVRGRTFLVPLGTAAYDTDGSILASRLAELRTAATDLAVRGAFPLAESLAVWHRPIAGAGGQAFITTSGQVNDRVAYLKSRRA